MTQTTTTPAQEALRAGIQSTREFLDELEKNVEGSDKTTVFELFRLKTEVQHQVSTLVTAINSRITEISPEALDTSNRE